MFQFYLNRFGIVKCKGVAESCITALHCTALNAGDIALICQTVQKTGVSTFISRVIKKLKQFYEIQENKSEMEEEVCQFIQFQEDSRSL